MNNTHTSSFLMANLGSEMSRLIHASQKGDTDKISGATSRAKRILEEVESFPEMRSRKDELEKIRYIIRDCGEAERELTVSNRELESFFLPFALNLMKQK